MRFSVLPRLKTVTWWPRASAASTVLGPRKPVPPRIRIFFDGLVWTIGRSLATSCPLQTVSSAAIAASAATPAHERTKDLRRIEATAFLQRGLGGRRPTRAAIRPYRSAVARPPAPRAAPYHPDPPSPPPAREIPGREPLPGCESWRKSDARDAFRRSVGSGAPRAGDS